MSHIVSIQESGRAAEYDNNIAVLEPYCIGFLMCFDAIAVVVSACRLHGLLHLHLSLAWQQDAAA